MRRTWLRHFALLGALALLLAACAPDEEVAEDPIDVPEEPAEEPEEPAEEPEAVGVIDGFKGTAPDPGVDESFLQRLDDYNPGVETIFAPQAYDCAMMIMLSAQAAGSVASDAIRDQMLSVTRGDNPVTDFEEARDLLAAGETINWTSVSGFEDLSDVGEPASATYEIWQWVDDALTTLDSRPFAPPDVEVGGIDADPTPDPADTDEALHIGYILPETGPLADLGPAQISGVELAIQEVNEAGGVLGQEVVLSSGDEAGDAGVASEEADRLLADGVHAIVGAAASGMSLAIIDQITGAGVVQCSASNTAPEFTDYDDNGYYFRTAPSDGLQGPALAEIILEDGHTDVALLARADDYGVGLLEFTRAALEEAGANIVFADTYDPEAVTFDAEVSEMIAAGPDAVAIVPFIDDGVPLIQTLIEQGWDMGALYGADGIRDGGLNERVG